MKKYAIILAAGKGSRMQSQTAKQFLELNGKPVLYYSIQAFFAAIPDINTVIVLPEAEYESGKKLVEQLFPSHHFIFCVGGITRFESVKNGLSCLNRSESAVILVHDAARCLVSTALIRRCAEKAEQAGSAIPVVPCSDSIRWADETGNKSLDRNHIFLVQTPQAFSGNILLPAFEVDYQAAFTDEASVLEYAGYSVELIEGESTNIKLTRVADLALAQMILNGEYQ